MRVRRLIRKQEGHSGLIICGRMSTAKAPFTSYQKSYAVVGTGVEAHVLRRFVDGPHFLEIEPGTIVNVQITGQFGAEVPQEHTICLGRGELMLLFIEPERRNVPAVVDLIAVTNR